MNSTDFVHLAIAALGGKVHGRTSLQKKVYFLGLLTDSLPELGYRPHFYGPYSDEVSAAVADLRAVGYIQEDVQSAGTHDNAGFERRVYDYKLTDAGSRVAASKAVQSAELWAKLQAGASVLSRAGEQNYMKLSVAAKTYFLRGQKQTAVSDSELADLAKRFGWNVSPAEVREAASYLTSLGLLSQPA